MTASPADGVAQYLVVGDETAFVVCHAPAGPPRATGVVLCPPFGWEDMCSYRSRRAWAAHLAADGHPALRLDFPGSGDSSGGPELPGRVAAGTATVAAAADWLRAQFGCARIAVIGIGLGGLLAARAAADGAAVDDLVLWGVPARGRTLVRELKAFARLEASRLSAGGAPEMPAPPEGSVVAAGYLMTSGTVADVEAINLSERAPGGPRRLLLLGRDGIEPDGALAAAASAAGAEVTQADGPGYGAMMAEPQIARPPEAVFARVSAWLRDRGAGGAAPAGSAAPESSPGLAAGGVHETPLRIGPAGNSLFGVLAEPSGPADAPVTLVLLNAGPQRRTGPNRMWVEIARRWAGRGVPAARVDLGGIGDADGDSSEFVEVAALYEPSFVGQVRAVLDTLEARGLPPRFVLLGLCSGAYWSFHTALQDDRVASVILLNPRALIWDAWVHSVRETRSKFRNAFSAEAWRRLLGGDVSWRRQAAFVASFPIRAWRWLAGLPRRRALRQAAERSGGDDLDVAFDRLRDRGVPGMILFTGEEPLHEQWMRDGRMDRLGWWPNLDVELILGHPDTHTLQPLWLQAQVHGLVDAAMERARADAPELAA